MLKQPPFNTLKQNDINFFTRKNNNFTHVYKAMIVKWINPTTYQMLTTGMHLKKALQPDQRKHKL